MNIDPSTTKYMIKARLQADGIVEKPDVVGAIFGQTEGLLGDELDLRDLQKSGRIGRIEVEVSSKQGKSDGEVLIPSSLDQVETVILASALETIDRVGPCKANIRVLGIEDVRIIKREKVVERAKELLNEMINQSKGSSADLAQNIRQSVQVEEITTYGKDKCPAGPGVKDSESIIIVEGRSDVLNLLKAGIKNAIAVDGTNIPKTVQDLSREKVTTAFVDGDRGGELILRELFQTAEIDFVARAPRAHEVEELSSKQLVKCLRNKVPGDQYMEMNGLVTEEKDLPSDDEDRPKKERIGTGQRKERAYQENGRRRDHEDRDSGKKGRDRFNSNNVEKFRKKTEDAEKEAARLRNRVFDVKQAADDRELEAKFAALKTVNNKIVKGQYDERDTLIQTLRDRELLADAAIAQLGLRNTADKPSADLPPADRAESCVDVASRATGAAIENYRIATECADKVDGLQSWIRRTINALRVTESGK